MTHEIERKFLVRNIPKEVLKSPPRIILQGYITENRDFTEVRLRKKDERYFLTIKRGAELVRNESETELTEEQFDRLWPMTENRHVRKKRYIVYPEHDPTIMIEVDVYSGELDGLIIAEVEFPSVADSEQFRPPDWFGREVTDIACYKNRNLVLGVHSSGGKNHKKGEENETDLYH